MSRKGFTLIELLIVIVIIAILVGAVWPYVQRYVEDAHISKAKQDLDEIRNALTRYETDQNRLYTDVTTKPLIGSYLSKSMIDPWGSPYVVAPDSSACYSLGPDRQDSTGDEIKRYFRPPLAISRAFWIDSDKNSQVNAGDVLQLKFSRPIRRNPGDGPTTTPITSDDFVYSTGAPVAPYIALTTPDFTESNMGVRVTFGPGSNPDFRPNYDTITVSTGCKIVDGEGVPCLPEQPIVIKSY